MDELLLETTKEKDLIMQGQVLVFGRVTFGGVTFGLPPVCAKRKFSRIDYEQMVMEVHHTII
jgi:hypothetical protein